MKLVTFLKEKFAGNIRNYLVLVSGSSVMQLLALASYPLLTRLYSPEAFGIYAIYLSVVAIASDIAAGKYEEAILLPKFYKVAFNIMRICFVLVAGTCLLAFLLIWMLKSYGVLSPLNWYYIIPVGIFFSSVFRILINWQLRSKNFKNVSKCRAFRSFFVLVFTLGFYFVFNNMYGLIIGNLMGGLLTALFLMYLTRPGWMNLINYNSSLLWKYSLKKYKAFPKFSIASNSLNVASRELPNLILVYFFGQNVVGQFSIAMRLMNIPRNLLAQPFGDIFYQNTAEKVHTDQDFLKTTFNKNVKRLFVLSAVITLPFFLLGESFFTLVLGSKWDLVGHYTTLLSPWLLFVFVFSPLSNVLNITQKLHMFLMYNILLFGLRITGLGVGGVLQNASLSVELFAWSSALMPMLMLMYIYKITNFSRSHAKA